MRTEWNYIYNIFIHFLQRVFRKVSENNIALELVTHFLDCVGEFDYPGSVGEYGARRGSTLLASSNLGYNMLILPGYFFHINMLILDAPSLARVSRSYCMMIMMSIFIDQICTQMARGHAFTDKRRSVWAEHVGAVTNSCHDCGLHKSDDLTLAANASVRWGSGSFQVLM